MIRLALFDVGETLLHDGHPFPRVTEALQTITRFITEDSANLVIGIVSDYGEPAATESERITREREFAEILKGAGIGDFFQPFQKRVTISARAGARKPDRRIFEAAAHRSATKAALSECLFITENGAHLAAARSLEMSILGFGHFQAGLPSFADWRDAPLLIAEIVDPAKIRNQERAITMVLRETRGIDNFKCLSRSHAEFQGQGQKLVKLDQPELGSFRGVFVPISVDVAVRCDATGKIDQVAVDNATAEAIEEAVGFVQQLVRRGNISDQGESRPGGGTHVVETDAQGRRIVTRQRYST